MNRYIQQQYDMYHGILMKTKKYVKDMEVNVFVKDMNNMAMRITIWLSAL